MADLTLKNLSADMLVTFGDAVLRVGDITAAQGLYRRALTENPTSERIHARLGLTLRPILNAVELLDTITTVERMSKDAFVGQGIATWLKRPAFISDARFMDLAAKHHGLAPWGPTNWHWNLQTVLWAAQQARDLAGDFVELGVFRGHTTMFVADYLSFASWPKKWWLFDTFDGIPEDQLNPGWAEVNKSNYHGTFSFDEVRERFSGIANIVVTKGRVPEVFDSVCPERISFMHVDLNSAIAEISALDRLYDRIVPGGIIVFDDFGWSAALAQQQAELEWFRSRGLTILPVPTGQGVFVKPPGN